MTAVRPPAAPPSPPTDITTDLALRLLAETRKEIGQADTKAAALLTVAAASAGITVTVLVGRPWHPVALSAPAQALWWTGCAAWAAALLLLLAAIIPRRLRSPWRQGHPLAYFADIRRAPDARALRQALADTARDPLTPLIDELGAVARIATVKHRCVHAGALCHITAILLIPMAALMAG
ncbi:Pycsar system effector family protein [Streptomyces sp. NPDC053048]|uniref:Pycsar system effector family protein n=1 Tax=Streptomyces sp. NPDC053048 TaxID=3365694 RepID=UPI0037D207B9